VRARARARPLMKAEVFFFIVSNFRPTKFFGLSGW